MNFKEFVYISELFDRPVPGKVKWDHALVDDGGSKRGTFDAGGYWYWIAFHGHPLIPVSQKQEHIYDIDFDVFRGAEGKPLKNSILGMIGLLKGSPDNPGFRRTNLGNEKEVFIKVKNAVIEFLDVVKPGGITWQAADEKLAGFYSLFAKRNARPDYKMVVGNFGGIRILRTDIADDIVAAEQKDKFWRPAEKPRGTLSRLYNKVTFDDPVAALNSWPHNKGRY